MRIEVTQEHYDYIVSEMKRRNWQTKKAALYWILSEYQKCQQLTFPFSNE